jgi:hypothetical protein
MKFGRSKAVLLAALFALVLAAPAYANQLYSQPYDGQGILNASQNDTNNGGLGNFATTYDNWNINPGGLYNVDDIQFTGGYIQGSAGSITGWTVNVYFDNGGIPGALQHTAHISGNGNETSLGGNIYSYDISGLGFQELSNIPYWVSLVPDLAFQSGNNINEWGWATGTGGDGKAYQNYFNVNQVLGADQAFTLNTNGVPEPGTLVMLGTGVLGLAGAIRRKLF